MDIRSMTSSDLPRVAVLCAQLGYPVAIAELTSRFRNLTDERDHALLVAEDEDGVVAGWIHAAPGLTLETGSSIEILGLVVDEDRRGRGIGRELLNAVERWAKDRGCPRLRVRSRVARERAHRFYERAGFARIKTQHAFEKAL